MLNRLLSRIRFFPAIIFSFSLVLFLFFAMGNLVFHTTKEDFTAYHEIMAEANPRLSDKIEKTPYTASQEQNQVRKDLFFYRKKNSSKEEKTERLHLALNCEQIYLALNHCQGQTALGEELYNVQVLMQHDLYQADADGDMQKVYLADAEKASISYENKHFEAEKFHLTEHFLKGHVLTNESFEVAKKMPSQIELKAARAFYDNEALALEGGFFAKHPSGAIQAEKALIQGDSEHLAKTAKISKNVAIAFKNGGLLSCQEAFLDFLSLQASFKSKSPKDFVCYKTSQPESGEFFIKSHEMELSLKPQDKDPISKQRIEAFLASGDAVLDYYGQFCILADKMRYKYFPQDQLSFPSPFPGLITFEAPDDTGVCQVIFSNGDKWTSPLMTIDTNKRQARFNEIQGVIKTESSVGSYPFKIKADQLLWDVPNGLLSFKGTTEMNHQGLGTFVNNEILYINYSDNQGKKTLQSILAEGHTLLCHVKPEKENCHWLVCEGKMSLDNENQVVILESPRDIEGKVCLGKQALYYDHLGEAQADRITIYYQKLGEKVAISKIVLEGDVYIVDHTALEDYQQEPLHYALADVVECKLETREMLLSAVPPHRVLFYDTGNHLEISAPAIQVFRDRVTQKDSIQGLGDVKFSFAKNELERFQQRQEPYR